MPALTIKATDLKYNIKTNLNLLKGVQRMAFIGKPKAASYPCGGCKKPLPFKKGLCGVCEIERFENFDKPATQTMRNFLRNEAYRITGFEVSDDSFWLYTDSNEWCDDSGASGFRASSETAVIKYFYERVMSRQEYDNWKLAQQIKHKGLGSIKTNSQSH